MQPNLKYPRVALTGYSRVGKDELSKALYPLGYERYNFGDIIKSQLDSLIQTELGFSSFTENDDQKRLIRHLLEHWGDVNYDNIFNQYFGHLPEVCVNTRLCRLREAYRWKDQGGVIILVTREGTGPLSQWEADRMVDLEHSSLIDFTIANDDTPSDLHRLVCQVLELDRTLVQLPEFVERILS